MPYRANPRIAAVATPPIAEAAGWVRGRVFPEDKPLLDVAQAVPSYPPARELASHLEQVLCEPETAFYTDILGLDCLRKALADHLSTDYDAEIESACTAITAGCNQAFCVAIDALAGPGDEVILPTPYYFNHHMWLEMRGIRTRLLPLPESTGGLPEPGAACAAIGPRTRAIVLVTPNNPTGAEYPPELLEEFYELARDAGAALVIDETYKDFRSREGPPHRLFQRRDWRDTLVHLYSFSKAYSLTGYRVGALVAGPRLLAEVEKILDCLVICPTHLSQRAALFALGHLEPWRREKALLMQGRVQALRRAFGDNRLRYALAGSGAYFAYVRHPFPEASAQAVARRLADEANILCLPGSMFGPGQERYLRFAFANLDAERIPGLVARLVAT